MLCYDAFTYHDDHFQRDINWVDWKRLGCPSFELQPLPSGTITAQASSSTKPISGKSEFFKPKKRFLGSSTLQQFQIAGAAEPWLKQLQGGAPPKTTEW